MTVLLTGATGFLGTIVAARLPAPPLCLVRGPDAQARLPEARVLEADLLACIPPLPHDVRTIVHCAADVAFDRPLEDARAINVEGTRRLLAAAAELPALERFVHVSTAYVAGISASTHPDVFGEDDLDVGQRFRNTYEQTKFEAERLVRTSGLPVTVVRPSIVVGDSATGWTNSFNVLYAPLRALARGLVDEIPADPNALVDVVPVDHVADVVLAAMKTEGTLHAVAGDAAPTAGELAALAAGLLGRPAPRFAPEVEPPGGLEVYAPYFTVRTRFDARRTRSLGLTPPALADYLPRVLDFAERARWGKRPLPLAA
ncbi:MAG: SDR family oxidoreductase [Solirubrobacteraceae bacterium]